MCWPEANLDPVQGSQALRMPSLLAWSLLPLLVLDLLVIAMSAQSSGFPKAFGWHRPSLEPSSSPPAPTVACSQLPSLKVLAVQTQAEIPVPSVSQWETVGASGCSRVPSCYKGGDRPSRSSSWCCTLHLATALHGLHSLLMCLHLEASPTPLTP